VQRRFQIVLSTQPGPNQPPLSVWQRFKLLFAGLAILIVAVAVLVVALIFGSILAAVLWVCLVLVIAAVILKAMWSSLKQPPRG